MKITTDKPANAAATNHAAMTDPAPNKAATNSPTANKPAENKPEPNKPAENKPEPNDPAKPVPNDPANGEAATRDVCHVLRDKPLETRSSPGPDVCHLIRDKETEAAGREEGTAVIELRVRNHPGAMSHITGLFARRAFNLEAILCAPDPADGSATSRMLLLVSNEPRLEQVERQLAKLYDVVELRHRTDLTSELFTRCLGDVCERGRPAGGC